MMRSLWRNRQLRNAALPIGMRPKRHMYEGLRGKVKRLGQGG
jgi:hypothetical protein